MRRMRGRTLIDFRCRMFYDFLTSSPNYSPQSQSRVVVRAKGQILHNSDPNWGEFDWAMSLSIRAKGSTLGRTGNKSAQVRLLNSRRYDPFGPEIATP